MRVQPFAIISQRTRCAVAIAGLSSSPQAVDRVFLGYTRVNSQFIVDTNITRTNIARRYGMALVRVGG